MHNIQKHNIKKQNDGFKTQIPNNLLYDKSA